MAPAKRKTRRRRQKRAKKRHTVKAQLSVQGLSRAGSSLNLQLYAFGEKIGELHMGRGALYWYGGKRPKWKRKRISWSEFAEMMDEMTGRTSERE